MTGHSRLIRPRVSYALSAYARLSAGIDFYAGDSQTYFGALTKNRLAFLMVSLVFLAYSATALFKPALPRGGAASPGSTSATSPHSATTRPTICSGSNRSPDHTP